MADTKVPQYMSIGHCQVPIELLHTYGALYSKGQAESVANAGVRTCHASPCASFEGGEAASELSVHYTRLLADEAYAVPPCLAPLGHAGRTGSGPIGLSSSQLPAGLQFMPTRGPTDATFRGTAHQDASEHNEDHSAGCV